MQLFSSYFSYNNQLQGAKILLLTKNECSFLIKKLTNRLNFWKFIPSRISDTPMME